MKSDKIQQFIELAGQSRATRFQEGSEEERKLGAQLLLSEVLEYVVHGLGVTPVVDGHPITKPNDIHYTTNGEAPDRKEMLDGLADVAYTMYWNKVKFGIPLEEAFELVCDNNLSKFVHLKEWGGREGALEEDAWSCGQDVTWPESVVSVEVIRYQGSFYAVGKDDTGKVRKPSTYTSVDLSELLKN